MVGVGFTLKVKDLLVPLQPLLKGTTMNKELMGILYVLVALKAGMSPVPEGEASPTSLNVCDQLYCVPVTIEPVNVMAFIEPPEHTVRLDSGFKVGVGLTMMLKATGVPWHVLEIGVTVIFAAIGAGPELDAIKGAMEPVPEVPKPITPLLLH